LLHTFDKFQGTLPVTSDAFKTAFTKFFPRIIDTKFILNHSEELRDLIPLTGLSDLFGKVKEEPFVYPKIKFATNFEKYEGGDTFHDAGFDAYCTGFSFLRMAYYLTLKGKIEREFFVFVFAAHFVP
jgi:poly(A)-specific ribonuclease